MTQAKHSSFTAILMSHKHKRNDPLVFFDQRHGKICVFLSVRDILNMNNLRWDGGKWFHKINLFFLFRCNVSELFAKLCLVETQHNGSFGLAGPECNPGGLAFVGLSPKY